MAGRSLAALALAMGTTAAFAQTGCPDTGSGFGTIAAVGSRLELDLTDGRRLRLVGLDPASRTPDQPDLDASGRASLAARLVGRQVNLDLLADKPDRWGRLPAMAFLPSDGSSPRAGGVAALAIGEGFGRYRPEPAAHACREALLEAEGEARAHTLGLWRDPYYGVLAVDDRAGFLERSATDVVAVGTLERVEVGPFRTKLRFAPDVLEGEGERSSWRGGRLVVVVPTRTSKLFEERGVRFEPLIGRRLRLRGLLDLRFGPQIELSGPDALEVLPLVAGAPAAAAAP